MGKKFKTCDTVYYKFSNLKILMLKLVYSFRQKAYNVDAKYVDMYVFNHVLFLKLFSNGLTNYNLVNRNLLGTNRLFLEVSRA